MDGGVKNKGFMMDDTYDYSLTPFRDVRDGEEFTWGGMVEFYQKQNGKLGRHTSNVPGKVRRQFDAAVVCRSSINGFRPYDAVVVKRPQIQLSDEELWE